MKDGKKLNLSVPKKTATKKSPLSPKKKKGKLGTKKFDNGIELQAYPPKISYKVEW